MNSRRTCLLLSTLVLATSALAETTPNFTGAWKLDVAKSDLGGAPIAELTVDITHKNEVFKYTATGVAGGENFVESEAITTDGKPSQDSRGATVTAHWDGQALMIESTSADGTPRDASRLVLSPDGKVITRDYVRKSEDDPQKRHEIYHKQ